jgi:hypothetical protein
MQRRIRKDGSLTGYGPLQHFIYGKGYFRVRTRYTLKQKLARLRIKWKVQPIRELDF